MRFNILCYKTLGRNGICLHFHLLFWFTVTALLHIGIKQDWDLIIFPVEESLNYKTWVVLSFCLQKTILPTLLGRTASYKLLRTLRWEQLQGTELVFQAQMLVSIKIQKHRIDDAPPSGHCILYKIEIYCSIVFLLHYFEGFSPRMKLRV